MSEIISSLANSKIKFIRKLRDRKTREESGLFLVEGIRIVGEAVQQNWAIKDVIFCPALLPDGFSRDLLESLRSRGVNLTEVDEKVFRSISAKDGPKGLAAIAEQRTHDPLLMTGGIWIGLDRIQDPGNLGTIFRTADAVGARGVILIGNCTDPYDPACVRGSMGALFSLASIKMNMHAFVDFVQANHLNVIGTSDAAAMDYRLLSYPRDLVLLMGSEREGLPADLMEICTRMVKIPMTGNSDSLNLAVAASVCLYEIYNQHNPLK